MHLSLWFVTKFMTATTAAVNASVRNEKKNTSQGPALFRSGKQALRRRQSSKRIPYSALFPSIRPACELRDYIRWPAPAWASSCAPHPELDREDHKPAGGPQTCRPPGLKCGEARRTRRDLLGVCSPAGAGLGEAEGEGGLGGEGGDSTRLCLALWW